MTRRMQRASPSVSTLIARWVARSPRIGYPAPAPVRIRPEPCKIHSRHDMMEPRAGPPIEQTSTELPRWEHASYRNERRHRSGYGADDTLGYKRRSFTFGRDPARRAVMLAIRRLRPVANRSDQALGWRTLSWSLPNRARGRRAAECCATLRRSRSR